MIISFQAACGIKRQRLIDERIPEDAFRVDGMFRDGKRGTTDRREKEKKGEKRGNESNTKFPLNAGFSSLNGETSETMLQTNLE